MEVLVTQSCLTLCNPMDRSTLGSSVDGILQARILEWVAIPSPRNLSNPEIKPGSSTLQADSLPSEPPGKPYGNLYYVFGEVYPINPTFYEPHGLFFQMNIFFKF